MHWKDVNKICEQAYLSSESYREKMKKWYESTRDRIVVTDKESKTCNFEDPSLESRVSPTMRSTMTESMVS